MLGAARRTRAARPGRAGRRVADGAAPARRRRARRGSARRPRARRTRARSTRAPARRRRSRPTARRRSRGGRWASASTSIASLPPSSTVTSFSRDTHARATTRPTAGEPVNRTLLTRRPARAPRRRRAPPCDDAHEPLRQARAREHPRDPLARQAGARGRLEDDAVAGQQRAGDLPERLRERRAAGADHADHAVGLERDPRALGERQRAADRDAPAAERVGAVVGDPSQRVDRGEQLERGDLRARPALLAREQLLRARRSRRSPPAPSAPCSARGP